LWRTISHISHKGSGRITRIGRHRLKQGLTERRQIDRERGAPLALASNYPFLDIVWTMFIFFAFVIWIWLLIMVLADNFSRRDHSGWAKAGWTLFVIFLPLLGVLVYMIARPPEDSGVLARAG
jgi:phospholipase D-like protein